jgi:predicted Zn-dependent peptidase
MVFTPYFTDDNIQKEKGIIEQEISMYDDDPSWRVYFNMLTGLYEKSPVKYEVAGTAASIKEIDKAMLYKCYDTFYTPGNMALICAGDFSPKEIMDYAKGITFKSKSPIIEKIYEEEVFNPVKKSVESEMSVSKPLFCLGFKDNDYADKAKSLACSKILLDILLGKSSDLYNKLYIQGILDNGFYMDYSNGSCFSNTVFSGAANDIDAAVSNILNGIKELKTKGIDDNVFERIKNKHIGRYIRSFNTVSSLVDMQAEFYSKGFTVFGLMDIFTNMDKKSLLERLDLFSLDSYCLSVVKGKA